MQLHKAVLFPFVLAIGSLVGCAASTEPPPVTQNVKGTVIYQDGKIFTTGGTIVFSHETEQGITSMGEIKADGTFKLHSITAQHKVNGAQVGMFKVTISPTSQDQDVPSINLNKKYAIVVGDNDLTIVIDE